MQFIKMHGAGNDYVYLDLFRTKVDDPESLAPILSDRHFGVGGDGIILIMPSDCADVRMRMFNLDGSEAQMCGNGVRCVAKYVVDEAIVSGPEVSVETGRGVLTLLTYQNDQGLVDKVRVNMGPPVFEKELIPFVLSDAVSPVVSCPISVEGHDFKATVLSMGNPHCVIFVDNVQEYPVEAHGSLIENSSCFPERTNVEFVERLGDNKVRIRTWERGSGETLACGTGASAVCAAMRLCFGTVGVVKAHLLGGDLELSWEEDGCVYMTGPAQEVFRGEYDPR